MPPLFQRQLTARWRNARLLAALCGVLLFSGQVLAQGHLHDDAAPGPDCVVCALAKSQTAAPAAVLALTVTETSYLLLPAPADRPAPLRRHPRFEARAPPAA